MSTTYTSNVGLGKPALNDRNWHTPLNADLSLLDALSPLGGLCVSLHEVPSTTLNVKVAAGKYKKVDGTIGTYAGTASQAITTATTKVLYLTDAGVLTVAASYPAANHVRLATVVAGATTITSITDDRVSAVSIANSALSGTVTSVAMTVPSYFTVAGSPVTTSGTLAVTATTGQTANQFLATPNGSTGAVSLRAIVAADLPGIDSLLPTQTSNSGKFLTTNGTVSSWATVSGSGTVTSVSVATANGFAGTVATATSTPAITITTSVTGVLKGNGTAISAATAGTDYVSPSGSWVGNSSITTLGTITTGTWTGTTIAVANGGTGQTTASAAINALVPSQTGQSGNFLTTNGTSVSWAAAGGGSFVSTAAGTSTMSDASNIAFGTTTGTKLGTGTTQKLGFYNATPIVQPTAATDLRQLLINLGFLATGGASPLDLNGGRLTFGDMTAGSLATLATSTTAGLTICTGVTQQVAFWGATPIGRPANAAQAAVTQTQSTQTDSTGGTASTTLSAITAGASYSQTDMTNAKNGLASLAARLAEVKTDVANLVTLVNRLRTDLVAIGLIKGSA